MTRAKEVCLSLSISAAAVGAFTSAALLPVLIIKAVGNAWYAAPILVASEVFSFLFCLPIWPVQVAYGHNFGFGYGVLLGWVGYTMACIPPFLLAPFLKSLARRLFVERMKCSCSLASSLPMLRSPLEGLQLAIAQEPFTLILSLRLNMVPPSGLTSYVLGMTDIPLRTYATASAFGCVPLVCAYVSVGVALESLAGVLAGRVELTPESSLVVGGATVMSLALMIWVSRRAGSRLKQLRAGSRVPREGEEDERAARASEADDLPLAMDQPGSERPDNDPVPNDRPQ